MCSFCLGYYSKFSGGHIHWKLYMEFLLNLQSIICVCAKKCRCIFPWMHTSVHMYASLHVWMSMHINICVQPCVLIHLSTESQGFPCWQLCWWHQGFPDGKVLGANMGSIWGRQDPGGPHDGPMNFAVWVVMTTTPSATWWWQCWPCGGSLFIPTNNSRAVFSSTSSLDIAYHQCCLHTAYWVLKDFTCF